MRCTRRRGPQIRGVTWSEWTVGPLAAAVGAQTCPECGHHGQQWTSSGQVTPRDAFTVPPCGHTWYGTQSLNGVRNGPSWFGGDLWSGYLYVEPDIASSSALADADFVVTYEGEQPPKAPPPGKKPPRFVPVAGPDGEPIRDASGELVMVDTLDPDSSTLSELDTLASGGASTLLRGEVVSETRTVSTGPNGELTETLTIEGR